MLTIKNSAHLRTNRHRRSFRACRSSTGVPVWRVEAGRHLRERIGLTNRVSRRIWLEELWTAHFQRVASRTELGGRLISQEQLPPGCVVRLLLGSRDRSAQAGTVGLPRAKGGQ